MSLNLLAPYPLPLGMERRVKHINLPVLLQRGCDELQSQDNIQSSGLWSSTPARAHGTHRWALCSPALPLLLRKGKCLFWITNEFFTLFTYCVYLQMNSESLASAWNWAFCEVQSAVDRNCFTLGIKPAHIANLYNWDGSSCQADLTAFALTYVMHYLINNHSGLGPKLGYWYCVKPL